jgi:phosphoenolpyruvate carboxykinase (GTP)
MLKKTTSNNSPYASQKTLAKIERVSRFYQENVTDTPLEMFGVLYLQRERLLAAKEKYGEYISPENFEKEAEA